MENASPKKENHYSVFIIFPSIYVLVNISFPFMAPFTQVAYSGFRATLSVIIRESVVQSSVAIALASPEHPI